MNRKKLVIIIGLVVLTVIGLYFAGKPRYEIVEVTFSQSSSDDSSAGALIAGAEPVYDDFTYKLGEWEKVPVNSVYETIERSSPDNRLIGFYLAGYKIFQRYQNDAPQYFTSSSDGMWQSEYHFIRRTPVEIKQLVSGFKIKCLKPADQIINQEFCDWDQDFWFTKTRYHTRYAELLREGLDFVVLPVEATDYDAEYISNGKLSFIIDDDGTIDHHVTASYIAWREPFSQRMGLYKGVDDEAPALLSPYEICSSEASCYSGFNVYYNDDPYTIEPQTEASAGGLVAVIISDKIYYGESASFEELYANPKANCVFIFQMEKIDTIEGRKDRLTEQQEERFRQDRQRMLDQYIKNHWQDWHS